uniref:Uncharacterized protein n=1 Tax=Siphoviridae sp. ctTDf8 TaxID=2825517 RepID=A0A8S5UJ32_9CAUD|nr:MAG TPA: hypothetical protein [Siphoviridae sp. ctTDf8]
MKDEIMKGVIWMTTDGIKDASMAYDYAEDAKEAGKPELAALFIEDAKYRLGKVKEWYERAMSMHGGQLDAITETLCEHYREWYRDVLDKVMKFHS